MTISTSSALPMNVLLIFVMHDLNGALFFNATSFCSISVFAVALTFILPFTTQCIQRSNHINLILTLKF